MCRCSPATPCWPLPADWQRFGASLHGKLEQPRSPLAPCRVDAAGEACAAALRDSRNPFSLQDQPGGTQSTGWLGAWTAAASAFAVVWPPPATRIPGFRGASLFAPAWLRPADEPPLITLLATATGAGPQPLFLQLEPLIGRDALLRGIRSFLAEPGAHGTGELLASIEGAAAVSLGARSQAWLEGSGDAIVPTLGATATREGSSVRVEPRQEGPRLFPLAAEVEARTAAGSTRAVGSFGLEPTAASISVLLPAATDPVEVVLDPDRRLAWLKAP